MKDIEVKSKERWKNYFLCQLLQLWMMWISLRKKEIKKTRPIKKNWYDWLINHIPKTMRKNVGGFKHKKTKY